jgi:hypothetical protein
LEVSSIIYLILFFIALLVIGALISRWRMKRAMRQVILIFREHSATSSRNAKTIDELGLSPQGMMGGMFKGRDYKQYALSLLMKSEIIQATEDGRLYLSEDKLYASGIDSGASYPRY